MSKVYVVMAHTNNPIAFNIPSPVAVFNKRKAAESFAEGKNKKATQLTYYIRSADFPKDQQT